jgi:hypothetical protein
MNLSNQIRVGWMDSNGVTAQQCYDYCESQGKGDTHKLDGNKMG